MQPTTQMDYYDRPPFFLRMADLGEMQVGGAIARLSQ